jgi:uncharacterized protein DUF1707/cell wall-active antibiotic response 4TMS protein YvqF
MPDTPLPAPPRPGGSLRAAPSEADRERVATLLSARFADDTLSLDEFEERVAAVYRAASRAELDALVADLAPAPIAGGTLRASSIAAADSVPAHDRRFAILANLEHHSIAIVARDLAVSAVFGNVELDLRDATFGAGTTEIHVRAVFGHIGLTLPTGAQVDQRASSILGSIECPKSPLATLRHGAPIIRLTGHAVLGSVEIHFGDPAPQLYHDVAGGFPRVDRPGRRP